MSNFLFWLFCSPPEKQLHVCLSVAPYSGSIELIFLAKLWGEQTETVVAAALFWGGCASVDSSVDNAKLKTFSDKEIEKVIRVAIGKPEGDLTEVDYLKVGRIDLHNRKINDISMLTS